MDTVYLALLKKWYSPYSYIIRSHRMINRIARRMLQNGYSESAIKTMANEARAYNGREAI